MSSQRAGRYVRQPQGYRAFIPRDLPPDPPIGYDDEMWQLLSRADRNLARLDGLTAALPNPDLFVFMYVRREAVLSSQIEGTQASLADLLVFEARDAVPKGQPVDVREISNYIDAMNHGLDSLPTLPVSLRLIRQIHERLLRDTRGSERTPGELRRSQNWIGGATIKSATFVPPPPHEMNQAIGALERFLHDERPLPDLIRVGLAHAQFETIHPFLDGNGRAGRLLITFLLCERGVLQRPLLYLSHYLRQHRSTYYDRLQAIRDEGDWEGWLKFFLRGVSTVAEEASETARRISDLREVHRHALTEQLGRGAASALRLIEALFRDPVITVEDAARVTGLTYSNANKLVRFFREVDILEEMTGGRRNRLFRFQPYLDLFAD